MGNCGLAPAPCREDLRQELYDFIEPCLGKAPGDSFFPKVSDFMAALESRPHPLNLGVLGATGAITHRMQGLRGRALHRGHPEAGGGLRPGRHGGRGPWGCPAASCTTPECYSTTEDFACLAKAAGEYGGYLTSHIRGRATPGPVCGGGIGDRPERPGWGVNVSH